jgi:hypothetical protein
MCGHVYIFGANENTSLKLDYLAIHQVIETKVEAHIHKHLLQGNRTPTLKGLAHEIEESCTYINITQKFSTFKYPTQHPHNLKNGQPL